MLAEQLLALVAEQCAMRPTILVIDDLQWADQASIRLWGRLARSARQMPLLLVGMMRPVPQRDDLLALRRAVGDAARLQLTRLTETAAAELVAALVGGKPDGRLLQLADDAAGNPLYITELVAALTRSSKVTITGGGSGHAYSRPRARLARSGHSGSPRLHLRAGARGPAGGGPAGRGVCRDDLAIVLDRSVADLVRELGEACAAGVLAESGNRLRFRHPLIHAALYEEMPAPVRAAWHREAGRALAAAGAPPDRVARQLLLAAGGPGGTPEPMEEWMLSWLADAAELLVSQAPQVAAELLPRRSRAPRLARPARPAGEPARRRPVPYRRQGSGRAGGEPRAGACRRARPARGPALDAGAVPHAAGESAESLATLDRALAAPGISARHRARLLVLAARAHFNLGEVEKAGQVAASALAAASEAGDSWAMGWALHVLTLVTAVQGHMTDALPLFDRALAVTQADPALTDLRLLLQINKAVALGNLDRYEEAIAAAGQARYLADQVGTAIRLAQAHGALGQLLFETGRWDDALAEVETMPENLKEPAAACCDLGIAAVIGFHRGETDAARRHLAAAVPHAERIGHRLIAPLALARSLDREHDGALPEALAALTDALDDDTAEVEEIEDLMADAVRLAIEVGD